MQAALLVWLVLTQAVVPDQRLISAKGIGPIHLGMTLGQARAAAPAATFKRTSDGDGAALVEITLARGVTLQAWADEDDASKPIDWRKKVLNIESFSKAFRTAEGVYPGMRVTDANRVYGHTTAVETSEIESRQFITFEKHPAGLLFRLDETGRVILSIAVSAEPQEQAVTAVEHAAAADLLADMAGRGTANQRLAGKLAGRGDYRYMMVRRTTTSQIQAHDAWDELIVVKEGSARMLHGGKLSGARAAGIEEPGGGPGERRGGEITGGTMQTLAAGDFLMIPAGIPHQVHVDAGQSITYLTIKVARALPAGRAH